MPITKFIWLFEGKTLILERCRFGQNQIFCLFSFYLTNSERLWADKSVHLLKFQLDCDQSLFFRLCSLSRGKEIAKASIQNWGEKKNPQVSSFCAPAFAISFPWLNELKRKIETARSLTSTGKPALV